MRFSRLLLPTSKETPAEAEVISHQLMLRAGLIRKLTSGLYTYLPAGLRVLQKIAEIVREEMNRVGAQELLMPMVQPADLWHESGRWHKYGAELLRFKDRHGRDYCLGPTHEEVITDIARRELHSYRQLPINLYQIQTKFRDEIRPRFGLMRGREFLMKDAYSFDVDDAAASRTYQIMKTAYHRIFQRCGLTFRAVEADTGSIGGSFSHEFMVLADTGEDTLVICEACEYAVNVEKAVVNHRKSVPSEVIPEELLKVETPGMKRVDRVAEFLGITPENIIKTMVYLVDKELVAVLVRGDRQVQVVKLKNLLDAVEVEPLADDKLWQLARLPAGYIGPVGLTIRYVADNEVMEMVNAVAGANEKSMHLSGVNPGRDFNPELVGDLRQITVDDSCPLCNGQLSLSEGIEVGHIFKLGNGYSTALKATFQDRDGVEKPFMMGCYGIGISRVAAAAVEQHYDDNGIIFPVAIAPFQVIILNLDIKNESISNASEQLYSELAEMGIDVLIDDRAERPGSKFKDADLIGIPYRLTVGKTYEKNKEVELRVRAGGETIVIPFDRVRACVVDMVVRGQVTDN